MRRIIYYFFCRVMAELWWFYHKWFIHKGKYTFWTCCRHANPYTRLYNDLRQMKKYYFKGLL